MQVSNDNGTPQRSGHRGCWTPAKFSQISVRHAGPENRNKFTKLNGC